MATTTGKAKCIKCGKDKATSKCEGCSQNFCYNHLGEHRQELNKQFDDLESNRDVFRETLNQTTNASQKHSLIQQIDRWEQDSIKKIKQTAEKIRQSILKLTTKNNNQIEEKLDKLTNQLKQGREEDDITEIDLQKWKEQLTEIIEQFTKSSDISIQQSSTPLVTYIRVDTFAQINLSDIPINAKWAQNGITVVGGNGRGNDLNQLYQPYGIHIDSNQSIYVADYFIHRIMEWKDGAITGQLVAGGNGPGNRNDQLNSPWNVIVDEENGSLIISDYRNGRVVRWSRRDGTSGETIISNVKCCGLAMDNNRYLYISDFEKHEVRRWKIGETEGTLVAGGNGQGDRFDQLNAPYYIVIDEDQSLYVSEHYNHRVTKWLKGAKEGIVVAGGQGKGNSLTQLSSPMGIIVDQLGTVYVADWNNNRVMRWLKGATEGCVVVGGNGVGKQANQLNHPMDLLFDYQNNLYIVDRENYRVQKFDIVS